MNNVTAYSPPAYWEDVSGNDHVALANPPAYDGGGNRTTAVDFAGDTGDNRILVDGGLNEDFDPGMYDDYSVSLWYNESTSEDYNYLLTKGNCVNSAEGGYSIATVSGVPTLRMNDSMGAEATKVKISSAGGALPTGDWHHLVAVFDRTGATYGTPNQVLFYVDTVVEGSATLVGDVVPYDVYSATGAICIGGRDFAKTNDFEGYMDDVAIYRGALSETDVNTLYTATSLDASTISTAGITPVMIHNFVTNRNQVEMPATVADDYDGHDGLIIDGAAKVDDLDRGDVLQFESTNQEYVTYGDVLNPGSGSYTVCLWAKADTVSEKQVIASKGQNQATGDPGWSIFLKDDAMLRIRCNYGEEPGTETKLGVDHVDLTPGVWHHIALVIDQENGLLKGYLDGLGSGESGVENGWSISNGNILPEGCSFESTDELTIGYSKPGTCPFGGLVDDFAIWTRALTDQEILDLYNGAEFPAPPDHIPGDATGEGQVDEDDAAILAQNWGASGEEIGWDQGDFNGDHTVNAADASILAANWGYGVTLETSSPVPEPTTLVGLFGIAAMLLLPRRRDS